MTSTAWDNRNTLIAILNEAQRSGKAYVDIEPSDLDGALRGDQKPGDSGVMHRDMMTKMMRPGDTVLEDTQDGADARMVIRYVFDANHGVA